MRENNLCIEKHKVKEYVCAYNLIRGFSDCEKTVKLLLPVYISNTPLCYMYMYVYIRLGLFTVAIFITDTTLIAKK